MFKKKYISLVVLVFLIVPLIGKVPKITLVFVVDQLAYHTFDRLSPYFKHGFKQLLQEGVVFSNVHHPHGNPVTATGHATIATGAYAKDHGVVLNGWMNDDEKFVDFGDDDSADSAVFSKNGVYDYGFSARHLLVDTLSDQLVLSSNPSKNFFVYAVSHKPRSAIAMAGKLGKAIWFDNQARQYTSSKAYFKEFPLWLKRFNLQSNLSNLTSIYWKPFYSISSSNYKFPLINNYEYAASSHQLVNHIIQLSRSFGKVDTNNGEEEEFLYEQTPAADQALINLCKTCIDIHDLKNKANHLVLWISVSNFDMLGHIYGHYSMETTDLLYHLDKQLKGLIDYAQKRVGKKNTLITLTADHGCCPIPELLQKQGFHSACRLDSSELKKKMNMSIEQKFSIKKIVAAFKNNQVFLHKKGFNITDKEKYSAILSELKSLLKQQSGIKECWTKSELEHIGFQSHDLEQYYKNQYHSLRSGDLILMPFPYVYIAKYPTGTGHTTPYAYDTQVPLVFYQYGSIEKKQKTHLVYITQLAPTLAQILKVSCPSGATEQQPLF